MRIESGAFHHLDPFEQDAWLCVRPGFASRTSAAGNEGAFSGEIATRHMAKP
jgi:hypothetical protein